jgi:peptidoglycan/xylan/chitin deacetylase (PgdA/CDA1 family)
MSTTPARDLIGYGGNPPHPHWPGEARVAVNFVMNYEEGSEYNFGDDGVSETTLTEAGTTSFGVKGRDLAAEGMFEYGSRVGFWRVARIFKERGLPLTVFGCALAIERNPKVAEAIRQSGWDVCSHGWRWVKHYELGEEEERKHIQMAVESLKKTVGERPMGWYCRYGPGVNTRRLVVEEGGFLYDSDAYNDDLPYFVQVHGKDHLVIPYTQTYNDFRFVVADGCVAGPNIFSDFCKRALDELRREGAAGYPKMMTIGLHPRLIGQAGRASALREFIEHALARGDVWFARRAEIARWWIDHHHEFER